MGERYLPTNIAITTELVDLSAKSRPIATDTDIPFDQQHLSTGTAEEKQFTVESSISKEAFDKLWKFRAGLVWDGMSLATKVHTASLRMGDKFPDLWKEEFGL